MSDERRDEPAPSLGDPPPMPVVPPPAPEPPVPPGPSSNGMAIASLVCGIVSIAFFVAIPIGSTLAILAVVSGGVGIARANGGAPYHGLAVAGIVCGAVGIVLTAWLLVLASSPGFEI